MSKRTTLECNGYVDANYIPDFLLFELDYNKMVKDIMPNIHNNPNIPQDVKDAWIELAVVCNIDKLYESCD